MPSKKPVWWTSQSTRDIDKVPGVTVAEMADSETEVIEGVPEDEDDGVGLFQRPISRLEHRAEDRPEVYVTEVDVTEVEGSDLNTDKFHDAPEPDLFHDAPEPDLFHDAPEQSEAMPPVSSNANGAEGSSTVGAGITDTETERVEVESNGPEAAGLVTEDPHPSVQQVDPVKRPPSRAQQIIERQPALMSEEIDGYDTEEEELRRRSLSRTRRSNHASRY